MDELVFSMQHRFRPYENTITDNSLIYKAQDLELQRDVCIKEIPVPFDANGRNLERNLNIVSREVRTLVRVSEMTGSVPSIHLTYFDKEKRKLYIVMEWIEGRTLDEFIAPDNQRVRPGELLAWMEQLCDILAIMARKNIYHKDIKPKNIIIDMHRRLRLLDFGLSSSLPNKVDGTPCYRAPEMETAKTVNRDKVDVFSIGVILYQYYAKKLPMKGREYAQKSFRNYNEDWDLFMEPKEFDDSIPERMNTLIKDCMQKDHEKRPDIFALQRQIRFLKGAERRGKKDF